MPWARHAFLVDKTFAELWSYFRSLRKQRKEEVSS